MVAFTDHCIHVDREGRRQVTMSESPRKSRSLSDKIYAASSFLDLAKARFEIRMGRPATVEEEEWNFMGMQVLRTTCNQTISLEVYEKNVTAQVPHSIFLCSFYAPYPFLSQEVAVKLTSTL